MSESSRQGAARPDARLSRRSLVAAAAIIAAAGPGAAGKALAFSSSKRTKIFWKDDDGNKYEYDGDKCHSTCREVVCFLRGTRLLTPAGEVAIEDLKIADFLVTSTGTARPIRWIGRIVAEQSGDESWAEDAVPIRVARDAFGAGNPHRDLYLSRAHMVHLDGLLIPIGDLINGRTIAPVDVDADRLEYFHVEFESHDVVLAEGAPCETLRLTPERLLSFDNGDEYLALYGRPHEVVACAPMAAFNGGRSELKSRLRSAIAPVIDIRQPMDIVRDEMDARALSIKAA